MRRILIWRKPLKGSDIDIFNRTEYDSIYSLAFSVSKWKNVNWGNKLWFQGICSAVDVPENSITYGTNETADQINDNYDLIIYPMANFFSEEFCSDTSALVKAFSGIRIPVYVIACGAQAKDYDHLEELVKRIGDPASAFIESIYRTGGEFALRGFFTKEFFNRLGFTGAVVTGCPSLFQMGPELSVNKNNDEKNIKPIINGRIESVEEILESMPESTYFSQDVFFDCLYDPDYFKRKGFKNDVRFFRTHGIAQADLLANDRIKMIIDMNEWFNYIRSHSFNYSFGTKVHGSIMPILAGIPATMIATDSRTREIAEFFGIPMQLAKLGHRYSKEDLLEAYEEADYSEFNSRFKGLYERFETFLREHDIVDSINTSNRFFYDTDRFPSESFKPNKEEFAKYAKKLRIERPILAAASLALDLRSGGRKR
ncbi:MAG: polysaccharide pyruvyl transferase family protein [Clostridia bacterium]|nr:polysaccharide pyruvyl transferase family protein [Clostridia bacterium]